MVGESRFGIGSFKLALVFEVMGSKIFDAFGFISFCICAMVSM